MKKSIPIIRERESEAFILGNGREREFPLTPAHQQLQATLSLYALSTFQVVLKPNWGVEDWKNDPHALLRLSAIQEAGRVDSKRPLSQSPFRWTMEMLVVITKVMVLVLFSPGSSERWESKRPLPPEIASISPTLPSRAISCNSSHLLSSTLPANPPRWPSTILFSRWATTDLVKRCRTSLPTHTMCGHSTGWAIILSRAQSSKNR